MRELKFRTWDIDDGQFDYAHIGQDDVWLDDGIGSIEMPLHHSDFEQYTGLKDKNGKEIYEGDIVKFDCGDQTPAEVFYQAGSFFLRATDDNSLFYDPETDKPCPLGWLKTYGLEVIGNIHENPELLGGEE